MDGNADGSSGAVHAAEEFASPELKKTAEQYIERDFENVGLESKEVLELSEEELRGWLQRDGLHVPSELMGFEVLARWTEHDTATRGVSFESLFCDEAVLGLPRAERGRAGVHPIPGTAGGSTG